MKCVIRHGSATFMVAVLAILLSGCASVLVKPSSMVSMGNVVGPGETQTLRTGTPEGVSAGDYQVPDGMILVITRVIIQPMEQGTGYVDLTFMQSDAALGDRIRQTWRVPRSEPTEYDFSPGYLISSGSNLKVRNNDAAGGEVAVMVYGYITEPG